MPGELFGGAIRTSLPAGFLDASDFRQIPDNQEVYVDPQSSEAEDNSMIVELVERLDAAPSAADARYGAGAADVAAARAHFDELVALNAAGAQARVLDVAPVAVASRPDTKAYMVTGTQPSEKWGRASQPMQLVLVLGVLRLAREQTDVLVSFNAAYACAPAEVAGEVDSAALGRIAAARAYVRAAVRDFVLADAGLFG
ncbi:uncharacterized protein V1510DRAFT_362206 [Dipodascopsis tothii]|uniref:uncharacterized protein n=1 Tax=Dipodascopsis tothii TaxID=44089 RepID=UPI0034CFB8D4